MYLNKNTGSVAYGEERLRDFMESSDEDFEEWAGDSLIEVRKSVSDKEISENGEWTSNE